jgi:DNA polymerase III alpha subunit
LEGKHLNLKNSFAVLNNNELMVRSRKMGVKVGVEDLAKFDILKDLESARSNLLDRNSNEMVVGAHEIEDIIPLEEMNLLEWKSDVSEEEDFQIVSSRKTKKNKRKARKKKETPGKKSGHPLDESTSSGRGVSRSCSRYNLRKKVGWDKNS